MKPTKHKGRRILPTQYTGAQTGAEAQIEVNDTDAAVRIFNTAKNRLLDINHWHEYVGSRISTFILTDEDGNKVDRLPKVGDLIRIDLPGPGPTSGKGYDWVCIEQFDQKQDIQADTDYFAFRVRPCHRPGVSEETPSHFYTDETTSTFIIQRVGTRITACEKGRNELPNTHTDSVIDNVRNTMVASAAASGLAIPQWKALMEGILKNDE